MRDTYSKYLRLAFATLVSTKNILLPALERIQMTRARICVSLGNERRNSVVSPKCSYVYMNPVRQRRGFTIKTAVNPIHPPPSSCNGRSLPLLGFIPVKSPPLEDAEYKDAEKKETIQQEGGGGGGGGRGKRKRNNKQVEGW